MKQYTTQSTPAMVWMRLFAVVTLLLSVAAIMGCKPTSKPEITRMRITPSCGVAPLNVECFAAVSGGNETGDPMGGTNTLDVVWDFGDGGTGTTSIAYHTYTEAGNYTIAVSASDPDGNVASMTQPVSVFADSLLVTANTNLPAGQATVTETIQFGFRALSCDIDYPARAQDEAKMTYRWEMGDPAGTVFTGPQPAFKYLAANTYDVFLTVTYPQLAITRHDTLQLVITP